MLPSLLPPDDRLTEGELALVLELLETETLVAIARRLGTTRQIVANNLRGIGVNV